LRVSLGIAYPERNLVRINSILQSENLGDVLEEVICHEAAHIAAYHLYGPKIKSHGPEWKELVTKAGFLPRTKLSCDLIEPQLKSPSQLYVHTCLICQSNRASKKPQPQWRCIECQESGLEGRLQIQSQPISGVSENA